MKRRQWSVWRILEAVALAISVLPLGACQPEEAPLPTAEVGVFYGGQVQRVERLEVSTVKPPKIGFRVVVPDSVRHEPISFELVRPGPAGRRVKKAGVFELASDQKQLDHVFSWEDEERLGIWNVRVTMGELLLADRALYLVPKTAGSL